jgi:hypothetical protein
LFERGYSMAGDGGYGGNGSVHFKNTVTEPPKPPRVSADIDSIPVANIGNGSGKFRVDLRFSTSAMPKERLIAELQALVNRANAAINQLNAPSTTEVSLMILVPAIPRSAPPAGPPNDPWEVYVKW